MKLHDMLKADVVDLGAYRKQKAGKKLADKLKDVQSGISQHYDYEKEALHELALLRQWMNETKQHYRVPGFKTISDVSYYLALDLKLPGWTPLGPSANIKPGTGGYEAHVGEVQSQQRKIKQWFNALAPEDQKKFEMIVHHVPRMMKALEQIRTVLRAFQNKWWKMYREGKYHTKLDAMDAAAYLDTELYHDMEELRDVANIAEIIQLQSL